MSAFKNAVVTREHRERAQPARRAKFGLLEKHKDYVKRAQNFHLKEKRLLALKKKAEMRNPDEFYFAMSKNKTKGGVHHKARGEAKALTADMVKAMHSQDKSYLITKASSESKKVDRLASNLHFVGAASGKHTVFVDGEEEAEGWDAAEYFDTVDDLVDRKFNRLTKAQLAQSSTLVGAVEKGQAKKASKKRDAAYAELEARMVRNTKMRTAVDHIELKRALLEKGKRKKVKEATGDKPAVYKWAARRKR